MTDLPSRKLLLSSLRNLSPNTKKEAQKERKNNEKTTDVMVNYFHTSLQLISSRHGILAADWPVGGIEAAIKGRCSQQLVQLNSERPGLDRGEFQQFLCLRRTLVEFFVSKQTLLNYHLACQRGKPREYGEFLVISPWPLPANFRHFRLKRRTFMECDIIRQTLLGCPLACHEGKLKRL